MRHTLVFLFLLALLSTATGQRTETVTVRKFTQKDGLSSYNIRKVIQDKWGFIWAGTQDGISRFDGRSFKNYTKNAPVKNRICGTDVRELIEDTAQNLIWVLPGEVGVNAINTITGEVTVSAQIPGFGNDDWNISMLKNDDQLWIGTSTGVKIYAIHEQRFYTIPLPSNLPKNLIDFAVRTIAKDEKGNIWACYDRYGIVIYNAHTKSIIKDIKLAKLNDHVRSNEIWFSGYVLLNGAILFATSQGLRKVTYSDSYELEVDNYPCKTVPALNSEHIEYVAKDKQGDVFITGFDKLYRFNRALTNYTMLQETARMNESDWLNSVQCIYNDTANNLWLGCQEGLAFMSLKKSPFKSYSYDKTSNTKLEHVRTIFPLPNGDILAGLRDGIVQIDNVTNKYAKYDTGHLYYHIFQDPKGLLIASRYDGMFVYNDGRLVPIAKVYPEFLPFSSVSINSHLYVSDTLVVLGSENNNGILLWNPIRKTVWKIDQGNGSYALPSSIVNNVYKDTKLNIWVLSDNIITIFSNNFKTKKTIVLSDEKTGSLFRLFFDMCETDNSYWITCYGSGVIQLDSTCHIKNVFSTARGLSNDFVYQIHNVANKSLFVTSNNGLSVLDLRTLKCRTFFMNDGLHANGFEEVCGLMKDGLIYAGGVNGFTIIDPLNFSTNIYPPTFYYTGIKTEFRDNTTDSSNLNSKSFTIPNNWLQTNISFIGLNYINSTRVNYQYRIKEQDTSWINLGTRNFVSLIGLNPGTYTLEVKAANEDGYWSEPKKLTLVFQPKWYQTLWFKLALVIAVGGLLYTFYLYRINQIKAQHLIRKNIASDLHDDIGSTLNTVKVFTHLAKKDHQKAAYFDKIEEALTEATTGLRDMIWVLDDTQDTVDELIERIKKFALPVAIANNISFEHKVEADPSHQSLSKNEKRNLLLMAKEIINNSIKHASCKRIKLLFKQYKEHNALIIEDDGTGFDNTVASEGHGLKNLYHRANQIGYEVKISSSLGNGTTIKITKSS